jgi:hypothetical protein
MLGVLLQALDSQPLMEVEPVADDPNTAEAPKVDGVWEVHGDSIHVTSSFKALNVFRNMFLVSGFFFGGDT